MTYLIVAVAVLAFSKEIRGMLLKLDTESLIAKSARDSKMYQLKQIVF